MRIALVLILLFLNSIPFLAQSKKTTAFLEKAKTLVEEKKYDDAAKTYEKAAEYFRIKNNRPARSEALLSAGQTYLLAKESFKVEQIALKILKLNSSKSEMEANAYQLLGNAFYLEQQLPEALKNFKWAERIRTIHPQPNQIDIARSKRMVGATYLRSGQTELAFKWTEEALEIFLTVLPSPHPDIAATYGTLGEIFSEKKQYDKAIKYFEQAIEQYTNTIGEQEELVAEQFYLLGKTYIQQGSYDIGLMNSQRGLTIFEDLKGEEHPDRAPFLNNLGKVLSIQGEYQEAFEYYYDALDLTEFHYGDKHPNLPNNYINIAEVLMAQSEIDSALLSYEKALSLNLDIYGRSHPNVGKNLNYIGLAYFKKNDPIRALAFQQQALALFQKKYGRNNANIAKVLQEIGAIYLEEKKYSEALSYFQKALNANVPDFEMAKKPNVIPTSDDIFDPNIFLSSLALKAETITQLFFLEKNKEQIELASEAFTVCDSLIENIRRSHIDYEDQLIFNNTVAEVYINAIENEFLLHQTTNDKKYLDKAFYFSEKSKSNVLLQSFAHDEAFRFADLPDSLETKENELKINISFFKKQWLQALQNKDSIIIDQSQKQLLEAKEAYRAFVLKLENNFKAYKERKHNNAITSLQLIQDVLEKRTGFIDMVFGKEHLYLFGVTTDNIFSEKIKLDTSFEKTIADFRRSVSDINYFLHPDSIQHAWNTYTQNGFSIYELLLENVLNKFKKANIQNLVIIPDGQLGYLPFEVLLKTPSTDEELDYTKLDYLIKHFTIAYDFSGSLYVKHKETRTVPEDIIYGGFAPTYGSGQLSMANSFSSQFIDRSKYLDLPASRMAVEQIAALLKGIAFTGKEATAENFIQHQVEFDILHVAMHGIYDIENPMNSHLVCARTEDSKENGTITASEIYNMNIHALLVILGSCNSGFGKLDQGEGVLSISRAFAYAGCPSLIKGLWSLPDEETAAITTHFIQLMKKGKRKDIALRKAKLEYLNSSNKNITKERFHPFFWSGFVPVGDMSSLYPTSIFSERNILWGMFGFLSLSGFLAFFFWRKNK